LRKYSVSVTALNVGNRRVLLDNSLTSEDFTTTMPRKSTLNSAIVSIIEEQREQIILLLLGMFVMYERVPDDAVNYAIQAE